MPVSKKRKPKSKKIRATKPALGPASHGPLELALLGVERGRALARPLAGRYGPFHSALSGLPLSKKMEFYDRWAREFEADHVFVLDDNDIPNAILGLILAQSAEDFADMVVADLEAWRERRICVFSYDPLRPADALIALAVGMRDGARTGFLPQEMVDPWVSQALLAAAILYRGGFDFDEGEIHRAGCANLDLIKTFAGGLRATVQDIVLTRDTARAGGEAEAAPSPAGGDGSSGATSI